MALEEDPWDDEDPPPPGNLWSNQAFQQWFQSMPNLRSGSGTMQDLLAWQSQPDIDPSWITAANSYLNQQGRTPTAWGQGDPPPQGGGSQPPPSGWGFNEFEGGNDFWGDFTKWFSQRPDVAGHGNGGGTGDIRDLLEWQRQGQNMNPLWTQWADYFSNPGRRETPFVPQEYGPAPPQEWMDQALQNPYSGEAPTGPGWEGGSIPPGWANTGEGWQNFFGSDFDWGSLGGDRGPAPTRDQYGEGPDGLRAYTQALQEWNRGGAADFRDRWNYLNPAANTFGLWGLMDEMGPQNYTAEGWRNMWGNPATMGAGSLPNYDVQRLNFDQWLDPSSMTASQMGPAAQMRADQMSDPSVSRAMQYAQGASDVAARQGMLQAGSMAQQLGGRRMNPAALAATMAQINQGVDTSGAAMQGYSQGLGALQATGQANLAARQNASMNNMAAQNQNMYQNAQFAQDASLQNALLQQQAGMANQGYGFDAARLNMDATNRANEAMYQNDVNRVFGNYNLLNQDRSTRMQNYYTALGGRQDLGMSLFDWLMSGSGTPGNIVRGQTDYANGSPVPRTRSSAGTGGYDPQGYGRYR